MVFHFVAAKARTPGCAQIFAHVDTIRLNVREHLFHGDDLLVHGVPTVVKEDIHLGVLLFELLEEFQVLGVPDLNVNPIRRRKLVNRRVDIYSNV